MTFMQAAMGRLVCGVCRHEKIRTIEAPADEETCLAAFVTQSRRWARRSLIIAGGRLCRLSQYFELSTPSPTIYPLVNILSRSLRLCPPRLPRLLSRVRLVACIP